jgi:hypothetical protein
MTVLTGVVSYPTPAYRNVPIHAEFYKPSQFFISNVTLGTTTIITTLTEMNYVVGQLIRLLIPASFGCYQLNGVEAYVLSKPAENQVEVSINSNQNVNQYIASTNKIQSAQIVAVGDVNLGHTNHGRNCNKTYIPGSFRDISPGDIE